MPNRVKETRTNISLLDKALQDHLFRFLCEYEPLGVTFREYCNSHCSGAFGAPGSSYRKRGRDRLRYFRELRSTNPAQFQELSLHCKKSLSEPSQTIALPTHSPPVPSIRQATATIPPSPSSTPPAEDMSDDEEPKDLPLKFNKGLLNLEYPERNLGVLPFRIEQVVYQGEMTTVMCVVLLLDEPRAFATMEVEYDSSFREFTFKRELVPENFCGETAKQQICAAINKKMPEAFKQWDGAKQKEADDLAAKTCANFMVWANKMTSNPGEPTSKPSQRRFVVTTHTLPHGYTARPNMFGCVGQKINPKLFAEPFEFGAKKRQSYGAFAVFYIMLSSKTKTSQQIVDPPARTANNDLEEILGGK
jgi:hypothetical protein